MAGQHLCILDLFHLVGYEEAWEILWLWIQIFYSNSIQLEVNLVLLWSEHENGFFVYKDAFCWVISVWNCHLRMQLPSISSNMLWCQFHVIWFNPESNFQTGKSVVVRSQLICGILSAAGECIWWMRRHGDLAERNYWNNFDDAGTGLPTLV